MATTSKWLHGVSGNFNTPSSWSDGVPSLSLPTDAPIADITASGTYTVTSSVENFIGALDLAKNATLDVTDNVFWIEGGGSNTSTLAGTIDVTNLTEFEISTTSSIDTTFSGTINLLSGGGATDNAKLNIEGDVTLTGRGKIVMSGDDAEIVLDPIDAATLNNDSTIVGDGVIGDLTDTEAFLTFNNGAKGVLDGNTPGGLLVDTQGRTVTNAGVMEATTASGVLILTGNINQTGNGSIKVATSGATVSLQGTEINGGQYSIVKGGILSSDSGADAIINTNPIRNAGTIQAEGASLVIAGPVDNTSTGLLLAGGAQGAGAPVMAVGTVKGGKIEIAGAGSANLGGPCSASILFAAGATGGIGMFDPAGFTGTVAGMSQAPGAYLDLENIKFADAPSVVFDPTTHLLTVADPVTHATDKFKIVGTGSFTKSAAANGSTLIADPPAANGTTQGAHLLAQSIASFAATGAGATAHDHMAIASVGSSEILTGNSHQTHG